MDVKKIVVNHYKNNQNLEISKEELDEFVKEYISIKELKEKYIKGEENRKKLGEEILLRTCILRDLMGIIERSMVTGEFDYKYPDYISDYYKALDLLIKLANNNGVKKYSLMQLMTKQTASQETRHGDKETKMFEGDIWVIGDNNILRNVDNNKCYCCSEFKNAAVNIINENNSLVIITNHYFESSILPRESEVKSDIRTIDVDGIFSGICCYTYNDELGLAVRQLKNYIDVYGGNINNISTETLVERINEMEKNNKTLKRVKKKK